MFHQHLIVNLLFMLLFSRQCSRSHNNENLNDLGITFSTSIFETKKHCVSLLQNILVFNKP